MTEVTAPAPPKVEVPRAPQLEKTGQSPSPPERSKDVMAQRIANEIHDSRLKKEFPDSLLKRIIELRDEQKAVRVVNPQKIEEGTVVGNMNKDREEVVQANREIKVEDVKVERLPAENNVGNSTEKPANVREIDVQDNLDSESRTARVSVGESTASVEASNSSGKDLPDKIVDAFGIPKERKYDPVPDKGEYNMSYIGQEFIADAEKQQLYTAALKSLQELGKENGVDVPDPGVLLRRLQIVDERTINNVIAKVSGSLPAENGIIYGVTLPDRTAVINAPKVFEATSFHSGLDYKSSLRQYGLHELVHSASQLGQWWGTDAREGADSGDGGFRRGITILPPERTDTTIQITRGLDILNEGFTEYLTQESLKRAGERTVHSPRVDQLQLVKTMIDRVGVQPFFKAAFAEDGLVELSTALDKAFGENALMRIAQAVNADDIATRSSNEAPYKTTYGLLGNNDKAPERQVDRFADERRSLEDFARASSEFRKNIVFDRIMSNRDKFRDALEIDSTLGSLVVELYKNGDSQTRKGLDGVISRIKLRGGEEDALVGGLIKSMHESLNEPPKIAA